MKKISCAAVVLSACLLALPVFGQGKEAPSPYSRTMSNLDKNGLVLTYRNTDEGMVLEKQTIALLLSMVSNGTDSDDSTQAVIKALSELFRESGIDSIRAVGSSVCRQESGLYRARGFLCMPEGSTGFMKDLFPSNSPVSDFFSIIPREAFLAGGSAFRLKSAFERGMGILKRNLSKEDFAEIDETLAKAKQEGADIPALLDTVRGIAFYLENVSGKEPVFPGFTDGALLLETANDSLYRYLLTTADPEDVRDGAVVLDNDAHVEMIQSGKYLIISNDLARAKDVLAGKVELLAADPAFKKVIPPEKEALGVFVWTPGFGALANNLVFAFVPDEHRKAAADLIRVFGLNEPFCSISMLKKDGFANTTLTTVPGLLCSTAATASGSANMTSVPFLAGMILPAIQQARMKAEMLKAAAGSSEKDDEE